MNLIHAKSNYLLNNRLQMIYYSNMPLSPHEVAKSYNESSDDYRTIDAEYKSQLLGYAFSMIVAEVAVVGFLLQNQVTRNLLRGFISKALLLASLYACILSIVLNVMAKRWSVDSRKNSMHAWQYKAKSPDSQIGVFVDGYDVPPDAEAPRKAKEHDTKSWKLATKATKYYKLSEYFLGAAVALAIVFLTYIIVR
jgi:hypothetical protein